MTLLLSFACVVSFLTTCFGLGWPLVARLRFTPIEKIVAVPAFSILLVYLAAWVVYVSGAPTKLLWLLPLLGLVAAFMHRREIDATRRDPEVRAIVAAHVLVTTWCTGWLALVVSYSGGGWAADWFEHWERMRFFLERWPTDHRILDAYTVPARPPLVNIVTGALLAPINTSLPFYQLVSTLLSALAFLPTALLARRFGPAGSSTIWVLAIACMVSPMFVQNATFAWTKLPAAFFVLSSLYFFLRACDDHAATTPLIVAGLFLGAGFLAHYSAGPYAVMLGLLWLRQKHATFSATAWRRTTAIAAVSTVLVLATWFMWAAAVYGSTAAVESTSTVRGADPDPWVQARHTLLNIRDTVVPHFLRSFDRSLIAQPSTWGYIRDFFFQTYQVNLLFAFGSVGWLALLGVLRRSGRTASRQQAVFWTAFVTGVFLLGIVTHPTRDTWGLAHICLQPLVLLGLATLAARWTSLNRAWRIGLLAGATFDLACGIVLHFCIQGFLVDRWFGDEAWAAKALTNYNSVANMTLAGKLQDRLPFFSDVLPFRAELLLALLAAILILTVLRARRSLNPPV